MPISLARAMRDVRLLGGPFAAESFWPWHALAKVISGERLDEREAALFRQCTAARSCRRARATTSHFWQAGAPEKIDF